MAGARFATGHAVWRHARGAPARGRAPGEPGHGRLVAPCRAGACIAPVRLAPGAARSTAGARDGTRQAYGLPRQPRPERGRNAVVLPPGRMVDLGPDSHRT